ELEGAVAAASERAVTRAHLGIRVTRVACPADQVPAGGRAPDIVQRMFGSLWARVVVLVPVLVLTGLSLVTASPAAAEEPADTVRNLDVTYDVGTDGSIDVTYRLDWDFGRKG